MPAQHHRHRRETAAHRTIGWLAVGLGTAAVTAGTLVAPADALQGNAARLMYLHVPAAWTAYLAFAVVFVASVTGLRKPASRWDDHARAAAEIGVVLTAVTIAVGSVWGRLVWGAWWVWDPRLVSTAMLLVVYLGYLAVRRLGDEDGPAPRAAALVGVAGFALVPVVHFSVVWWRSVHQQATVLAPDTSPPIDPLMAATLTLSVAAATAGAFWVYLHRIARLRGARGEPAEPVAGAAIDGLP